MSPHPPSDLPPRRPTQDDDPDDEPLTDGGTATASSTTTGPRTPATPRTVGGAFDPSAAGRRQTWNRAPVTSWNRTGLYAKWYQRCAIGYPNDLIIAITPSSYTGVSGTGKTTLAVELAETFDLSPGGFDAETQATLDAADLAYNVLPNAPHGGAIIFDEAQGAPGTESLNSRRGMKTVALDAMGGVLANRDNRNTIIIIGQQLSMLDSALYPMLDAWILIKYEPDDPKGPLAVHHELISDDYKIKDRGIKTPAVEELTWKPYTKSNRNYRILEEKKQRAKRKRSDDDGDGDSDDEEVVPEELSEFPKPLRDAVICDLYEKSELTQKELANVTGLAQTTISDIVRGGK